MTRNDKIEMGTAVIFTDKYGDERLGIIVHVDTKDYQLIELSYGNRWSDGHRISTNDLMYGITIKKVEADNGIKILSVLSRGNTKYAIERSSGFCSVTNPPKPKKPQLLSVKNFISKLKGKIFTVAFRKVDGSARVMNCRTGVSKYVKGTGNNVKTPGLITVFELSSNDYRSFYADRVLWIKTNGINYVCHNGKVIELEPVK